MAATSRLLSPLWGHHVHTVSPAVAQVRRTGLADATIAAFARVITDCDQVKRALAVGAAISAFRPCLQGVKGTHAEHLLSMSVVPLVAVAIVAPPKPLVGFQSNNARLMTSPMRTSPLSPGCR